MLSAVLASILALAATLPARPGLSVGDSARFALDRLACGPRPGDVHAAAAQGVLRWINAELDDDAPDRPADEILRLYPGLARSTARSPRERLQLRIARACVAHDPLHETLADVEADEPDLAPGSEPGRARDACRRLCARLIADPPPERAVAAAAAAWSGGGSAREVVWAIARSPEFWAAARGRGQLKTSFEFVVSAVRALGASPDTTFGLAGCVARLDSLSGAPGGAPTSRPRRLSDAAQRARREVALALAAGRLPGAWVELDDVVPWPEGSGSLADQVNEYVAHRTLSAATRRAIARAVRGIRDPVRAAERATGLALASAEFQRR